MLDLAEIRERMRDRKITHVAKAIGVHKATLYRIVWGDTVPTYETLKQLSDYLLERGQFKRNGGEA